MSFEQHLGRELERALPLQRESRANWDDVLRRAGFSRRRPRGLLVLAALVVVLGVPSAYAVAPDLIGQISDDGGEGAGRSPVVVIGGTPAQRELVMQIVGRIETRTIERIQILPADPRWGTFPDGSVGISVSSREPAVRAAWEEILIAGAFHDLAEQRDLPPVVYLDGSGYRFALQDPGARTPSPSTPSSPVTGLTELDALASHIREAAKGAGGDPVEVEVVRPHGLAVAVTLQSDDPARFLSERFLSVADRVRTALPPLDGFYLAVADGDGELVHAEYSAQRVVLTQGSWTRPDLRGCVPPPFPSRRQPGQTSTTPDCPKE